MKKTLLLLTLFLVGFASIIAQTEIDKVEITIKTNIGYEIGIDGNMSLNNEMTTVVPIGSHEVTVMNSNGFSHTFSLEVTELGDHIYSFPVTGKLNVNSEPDGASVYVDGIYRGVTPVTLELTGAHSIRVEKDPKVWYNEEKVVDVEFLSEQNLDFHLQKLPPRKYVFLNYDYSIKHGAHSFMLGRCRQWGWYMRLTCKGDVGFTIDELQTDRQQNLPSRIKLEDEGLVAFNVGVMRRFTSWLYGHVGTGWGCYEYGYNELNEHAGYSGSYGVDGVSVDAGLIARWKFLNFSCGYTGIVGGVHAMPEGTRFGDFYVGVGFAIPGRIKNR